ncbi:hypothetical protein KY290_036929 [Solanum tuberosum]|uniref:Uncharacterized protein n=1 Tax=Solanum tuberosum TaxID=4113 RepID=A0ABQ7TVE9_SOLTU|nr:hypothetical protein KY284_037673 [Solanum tuberosum]KAH0738224.1 hypothetical protein KY290_036929 [Solanum tuberosum]
MKKEIVDVSRLIYSLVGHFFLDPSHTRPYRSLTEKSLCPIGEDCGPDSRFEHKSPLAELNWLVMEKQDRKQNKIEERKATRFKLRSGVKPFSEGAGLADGNGISGNAVKGEGAKEANSNEESFRGVTPSRS